MKLQTLNKKQANHATAYQCLNPKCKRQIALIKIYCICPICENGGLKIIDDNLPF